MNGAVLFDFGGTLDADGLPWKERFYQLCRDEGVEVAPPRFDALFYAADDALVDEAIPATLSFRDTVHRLAAGLCDRLGCPDDGTSARIAERFLGGARESFARNTPVLEALSARYRLGVVSNFYGNLEA